MFSELALRTQRLELDLVRVQDAGDLYRAMSDPRVSEFLAWAPHSNIQETEALIEALQGACATEKGYHWTIRCQSEAIGIISLIDVARKHRLWTLSRAEIAYWIAVEHQGAGFATEATQAVIECAFERLQLNRLKISHTSANAASGRIPQKMGFAFTGTEHQFFQKNGVWFDMNHYELLADTWRARKGVSA